MMTSVQQRTGLLYASLALAVTSLAATTAVAYLARRAELALASDVAERHLLTLDGVATAGNVDALHIAWIAALVTTLALAAASLWLARERLIRRGELGLAAFYALAAILFIPVIATFVVGDPPGPMEKALDHERWEMRERVGEWFLARADEILGAWTPANEKPLGPTTIDRPVVWLDLGRDGEQPSRGRSTLLGIGGVPQVLHEKLAPSLLVAVTRTEVVSEIHYVTHTYSMPFVEPKVDRREPGSVAQLAWHVAVFTWPEGEYLGSERLQGERPTVTASSVHAPGLGEGPAQAFLKRHDPSGCVMVGPPPPACAEASLSADDPTFSTVLMNLATLHELLGDTGRAEQIYARALAIQEKALSADDPALLRSLNPLAMLHHLAGRYGQAEPLYRRSIAIAGRAYGPDHPYVAMLRENLAELRRLTEQERPAAEIEQR
jgi:tetratricopeptide (TPR) repeat protein